MFLGSTYPASPVAFLKHVGSSALHSLQNSPDSVQSSTLSVPTWLFLVAVSLNHRPVSIFLSSCILEIAVLVPPHESRGLPSTSSTARKSDLPPALRP